MKQSMKELMPAVLDHVNEKLWFCVDQLDENNKFSQFLTKTLMAHFVCLYFAHI